MSKYIPAEKLIAEIERLKGQLIRGACASQVAMETNCKDEAYNEILSFITSLQQEQTEVDLKIEIGHWLDSLDDKYCSFVEQYSWQDIKETARHFYELGKARKEE